MDAASEAAVYTNFSGLARLRAEAQHNSPQALRAAARQFEGIFLEMVLKSMRAATPHDSMFDSQQTRFYQDLFDHQVALNMAGHGDLGLTDLVMKQLQRLDPGAGSAEGSPSGNLKDNQSAPSAIPKSTPAAAKPAAPDPSATDQAASDSFATPADFVRHLWGYAKRAAEKLNVDPQAIIAQAALETGWGQHVMQNANGGSSYNLFGIKADANWNGKTVTSGTLEFTGGVMKRQQATFRAYDSIAQSVADYVHFLKSHPRYRTALQGVSSSGFGFALQRAGYATDPKYGYKYNDILNGSTLKQALSQVKS